MGKSENYVYGLETIAAIGLEVGLSIQINEVNEYQRSMSLSCFSQKLLCHLEPNFI